MRYKSVFGVSLTISLLLICISVSAASSDDFSFQSDVTPQPPLALIEANINSEGEVLTHEDVYEISVQVMNTRSHEVDGVIELAAFSLSDSPISLGLATVNLDPDGYMDLQFTFSLENIVLPCTNYILMVTTEPSSSVHINERDYIFVDGRREFTLSDCFENEENKEIEADEEGEENEEIISDIIIDGIEPQIANDDEVILDLESYETGSLFTPPNLTILAKNGTNTPETKPPVNPVQPGDSGLPLPLPTTSPTTTPTTTPLPTTAPPINNEGNNGENNVLPPVIGPVHNDPENTIQ